MTAAKPPQHGGNPELLAQQLGLDPGRLLDLSSGVSPFAYPLPAIPPAIFEQLPYDSEVLHGVAADYYGVAASQVLAAAGSQMLIQALPRLRRNARVLLPRFGYEEHRFCWMRAGHQLAFYDDLAGLEQQLVAQGADVVIIVHPNNPSGEYLSSAQAERVHSALPAGSWLIVDEAFIDAEPEQSLSGMVGQSGMIVLRSIGKFFGLPGLRLGFALAEPKLLAVLELELGPWPVCASALWAGPILLRDRHWQQTARRRLCHAGRALQVELEGLYPDGGKWRATPFFSSCRMPLRAVQGLQQQLAEQGVLTRVYQSGEQACLRVGLPASGCLSGHLTGPVDGVSSASTA